METNTRGPQISAPLMAKIAWRLAPLMIIMYISNQLDRANVGYAALTMNAELGLTAAQFGLATSVFYIGYILFEVPSNLVMRRVGARLWMARILFTWGIAASLTSLVSNLEWLLTVRFFLGVFEAGLFPGMVFYMTLWMPMRNRVWLMAWFVTAIPLTGMLGAPISTLIMQHVDIFGLGGWRAMLLLEGLPPVLLGILVLFYLPDRPAQAKWLSAAEVDEIETALAQERQATGQTEAQNTVWSAFRNPKVWGLGIVYFGVNCGIISLLYFLPQVVRSLEQIFIVKFSIVEIGLITAVPFGFAIASMLVWGRFMLHRDVRPVHVAGPLVVCAISLAAALYLPSAYLVMAAFAIGTAATFCTMVTFWQLPSRFLTDRAAAAGIALITSLGVFAGVVLPYMIGWIRDLTGVFALAYLAVAAFILVAAGMVVVLEINLRRTAALKLAAGTGR